MPVTFSFGDIILATIKGFPESHPISGLSNKPHTFMVIHDSGDNDLTVCMVTSTMREEIYSVKVLEGDGRLHHDSYIRTHKIMLISKKTDKIIKLGRLKQETIEEIKQTILSWL